MFRVRSLAEMIPGALTEGTILATGALAAFEIRQRVREALEDKDADYPVPDHPSMRPDENFVDLRVCPRSHSEDSSSGGDRDARPGSCDGGGGSDRDGDFRPGSHGRGGNGGGGGDTRSGGRNEDRDVYPGGRDGWRGGHGNTCSGTRDGGGGADRRVGTRIGAGSGRSGLDGGACAGTISEADAFRCGGAYLVGGVRSPLFTLDDAMEWGKW
ncbi:loricrin-like [Setaria italica]|uniref:loricrin-like n=1 Tax=Setaria italica TaxID=4555 RepID=UPI000350CEEE|nr:loricrin-like [Setaria italica]